MAATKYKVESGAQLLARLIKKPVIEDFYSNLFQPGLKNNDVVEVLGNNSSALLIDLINEALAPSRSGEEPIGVLIFNTVGHLDYKKLINALKKKIASSLNTYCDSELDTVLHKTLNNLFILDIYDGTQFYTTIHNLDNILAHHQNISLLIFDTLTAFYWSEQGLKITKMDLYVKNVLRMIQKVSKEYKVILIYTRPGYFNSSKDSGNIGEVKITEGINFKVQLVDNISTGAYEVNVRTIDSYYHKKYLSTIDNEINWQ
ncbi:hypothetical protein PYW07_014748 [Mythimna separata]|uniref:DNA recombination and repair protein Rad51-like C-terminal domain-containing protein n=1 Tax=Mythimna separata TaxID=271217 RepID=A0AAD8DZ70_MYTSE|nr:hypothetical protein PYW07_014748 [Mythimna separata]